MFVLGGKILSYEELPSSYKLFNAQNYKEYRKWLFETRFRRKAGQHIIQYFSYDVAFSLSNRFKERLIFRQGTLSNLTKKAKQQHFWCSFDSNAYLILDFCIPLKWMGDVLNYTVNSDLDLSLQVRKCLCCGDYYNVDYGDTELLLYCSNECKNNLYDTIFNNSISNPCAEIDIPFL
jgi:hypothetical protein